jgi:hypothetical protein
MTRPVTRLAFKAIDIGASAIFMALCAKAFCVHFYCDVERAMHKRRSRAFGSSPLLFWKRLS